MTLADLADERRWVAWRNEPRAGNPEKVTKVPYGTAGKKAKANDPRTWSKRAAAEACAKWIGGGIGLELGEMSEGFALGGVDLDTCRAPDGTIEPWAREIIERFNSYAEVSPSDTGAKVFFRYPAADLPELCAATGIRHGRTFTRGGGGDHPPAIELHLGNRFFAVTEQQLDGAPETLALITKETLLWLIREAGPRFAGTAAGAGGKSRGADNSRSAIAFRQGSEMCRTGASFVEMCDALRADPKTAEWVREKGEANGGRELRRIWKKVEEAMAKSTGAKPDLVVAEGDLPAVAQTLRDHLAACGDLFDRDMPVKLVWPADGGPMVAIPLTVNRVVAEAHRLCQPVKIGSKGQRYKVTLPERVARLYLDMAGEWDLPPLAGISTAPLLTAGGGIHDAVGYDRASGLFCCEVPPLSVPECPRKEDAAAALRLLRETFKTFPFADAARRYDPILGVEIIDLEQSPGRDESAFLVAKLTAICRASLWLAPGFLFNAPQVSGAGTGKGLVVRVICATAFGTRPRAFTPGHDRQELDKRLAAELSGVGSALFLDNVNSAVLHSAILASALTERPARVRLLGQTRMVSLNSTAFIAVTGNGLAVAQDLARRFIFCELDARCEDPEARPFAPGFLETIERRRAELLAAGLTIWRFGRQNASDLQRGRPLGSFETWCEWVRDPLLTLGCRDPVERIELAKARDPHRQRIAELFRIWNQQHGDAAIKAADLAEPIRYLIDPQGRGRQYVATCLGKLAGTRAAGFVLTRQETVGKWGAATYSLHKNEAVDGIEHRRHRDHWAPMPPMVPMPDAAEAPAAAFGDDVLNTLSV